jgi:gliding motility-associated-like protein
MRIKLLIILFLLSTQLFSQNLVNNPGFEQNTGYPNNSNELRLAVGWSNCNTSYGPNNNYGTPDYYSLLGSGGVKLPDAGAAYINPYAGNCIMGEVLYDGQIYDYREYAQTFLTSSLVAGRTYIVFFYTSIGDSEQVSEYLSNNLGILFSVDSVKQPNQDGVIPRTPQINMSNVVSPNGWEQYSFTFKADSAYKYITIGNFYDDASTTLVDTFNTNSLYAYYFFDNFSVIPIDVSNDTTICQGRSVTLSAHYFSSYAWSTTASPTVFSTDSVITVTPSTSTNYLVSGNGITDTIKVTVMPRPDLNISSTQTICKGSAAQLNVSGANTYSWLPTNSLSCNTCNNPIAAPTINTTYTLYGASSFGCKDSANVLVKVNSPPIVTLAPSDSLVCNGLSVPLTAAGAFSYQWSPSTGLSSTTDSVVVAAPTITTTYTVYGANTAGCIDTITAIVNIIPNSIIIIVVPANSIICLGDSAFIKASGGTNYSWSPSMAINTTTGDTITANPASTATYTVIGTGLGNCADTTNAVITVIPPPVITVQPGAPAICFGHPVQLSLSGASTYYWNPSTGLNQTTGSAVSANPTVTNTYTVYGTDVYGCNDSTKVVVIVNPLPIVNVAPLDSIVCNRLSVPLSANGALTYEWSPLTGLNSSTDSSVVAAPLVTTTYTVYGTDGAGCTDTVTAIVNIIPNSIVIIVKPANSIICLGDSASLTASGGTNYSWSPSMAINTTTGDSITANPVSTATYTVIGIGVGDCSDTTSAVIMVSPPPVISVQPDSPEICNGQAIPLTAIGALKYEWSPSTGLYETSGSTVDAHPAITTTYTIYGRDSLGCNDSTKFTLDVNSAPLDSFTSSAPSVCYPLRIQFSNMTTGGISYLWNFGDSNTGAGQNPSHEFVKPGIYKVTLVATAANGCTDTVAVSDTLINYNAAVITPNAFAPASGGLNQLFKPDVLCTAAANYLFRVYDRWGELVYQSTDPTQGWSGNYNGKPEPVDVYVYYIEVTCGTCSFFKKGNVTLLR